MRGRRPDPGATRILADDTVGHEFVDWLKRCLLRVEQVRGPHVAVDDHLAEARRRGCVLLTRNPAYLDDARVPFEKITGTAAIVMSTPSDIDAFGGVIASLLEEVGRAGNAELAGKKVELVETRMVVRASVAGRVVAETITTSWTFTTNIEAEA